MEKSRSRKRLMVVWVGVSIVVVVVGVLAFVGNFLVAAYNVPTGAMEKTIRIGGRVLVKRQNYLPAERGDIFVFHFPVGDTVIDLPEYRSAQPYYDVIRELGHGDVDAGRQIVLSDPGSYPLSIRPVNKRENYIKRFVGIPGDQIEQKDGLLYINGKMHPWAPTAQTYFYVTTNGQPLDEASIKKNYDLDLSNGEDVRSLDSAGSYVMLLTWEARKKMLADGFAKRISADIDSATEGVFPFDTKHPWTRDNYGPIWIPKKGASIELTALNYPVYERIIRTYEGNRLEMRDGKVFINGQDAHSYTFKMNYYWALGDNLHASQDSRYWGFVPEDHLIGKVWSIR